MNELIWYVRRLSCMSIQEVIRRLYKSIRSNLNRFAKKDVDLEKVLRSGFRKTVFCFDPEEGREGFLKLFPDAIKGIVSDAEALCRHNFRIFNIDWNAGHNIHWHDVKTEGCFKDIRFIWEFNRHQHLVTLGKAYFLVGDIGYAQEIKNQIFSWIKQNPPYTGVNWASPLELGLRLISWCWVYKFIDPPGVFSEEEKEEFLKSVYLQTEFIEQNLSKYSSANNHLIGEACGLIVTALTFPEFRDSDRWLTKGKKILFREISTQVHSDGVTKEQAFGYQGFIMELFLLAAALLKKNDMEVPRDALDRFYAMAEFIMNIIDGNGNVPNVGDSDNGRAIIFSHSKDFKPFKSILAGSAIMSGRGDFKAMGGTFREEHYWLFGREGLDKYNSINSIETRLGSRFFERGGYTVLRDRENLFIMDCGELGYGMIAAHGHADSLAIMLNIGGRDILVDPGTYLYLSGNGWRDYFRSTKAHNTVRIDRIDQSETKGPFLWGYKAGAFLQTWLSGRDRDKVSAYHTGYIRLGDPVIHSREIIFDKLKREIIVTDSLISKKEHFAEIFFHLHPDCVLNKVDANTLEVLNRNAYARIELDPRMHAYVLTGSEDPVCGWYSGRFGEKVKTSTICAEMYFSGNVRFTTRILAGSKR